VLLAAVALGACAPDKGSRFSASGTSIGDDVSGTNAGGGLKPAVVVRLEPLTFEPADFQVQVGRRVVWKWAGGVQHNVRGGDEFKSELKSSGEFSHTFDKAGTYEYICDVHATTMKGTVEVVDVPTSPTSSSSQP